MITEAWSEGATVIGKKVDTPDKALGRRQDEVWGELREGKRAYPATPALASTRRLLIPGNHTNDEKR